jgi:hypothetical protein
MLDRERHCCGVDGDRWRSSIADVLGGLKRHDRYGNDMVATTQAVVA